MKTLYSGAFFLLFSLLSKPLFAQEVALGDLQNFTLEKVDGKELLISFKIKVKNPSGKKIGINIKRGLLFKDGEHYGSFRLAKKIKLHKTNEEVVTVPIKVTLEKDLKIVEEGLMMLMGKPTELKISGVFKATWFIFWKKYPFDYQEKLSLKSFMR